jgi:glycosyltransferase involved in cell wall biosynthesis
VTLQLSQYINQDVPLISVITPVYNGAQYLDDLILSVKNQEYPRIEHIVIDDGSNDDGATIAVLSKYPHLKWWTRSNLGQYATLNEGINAARGDWLCIISADDLLASPSAFSKLLSQAVNADNFDAIFGRTTLMNEMGADIEVRHGRPDESAPKWLNYHFLVIHHCSMLVARKFLVANELCFDTSLRYTGDWDWIIRILKLGRTGYFDVVVSKYRIHEQQTRQTTSRKRLLAEDRLVLSRHGSSVILNKLIIAYFRVKKLVMIFSENGSAGAAEALRRFFGKF